MEELATHRLYRNPTNVLSSLVVVFLSAANSRTPRSDHGKIVTSPSRERLLKPRMHYLTTCRKTQMLQETRPVADGEGARCIVTLRENCRLDAPPAPGAGPWLWRNQIDRPFP